MKYSHATTVWDLPVVILLAGITITAVSPQWERDENSGNSPAKSRVSETTAVEYDTLNWSPPRFTERQEERSRMVEQTIEKRGITDPEVLEAMRNVPRHLFMPASQRANAYRDRALPIGYRQTISQPYIVAYMTKLLDLGKDEKVLEIGTGSGYQAAVLSELTPHVFTIEIVEELGRQARKRFKELGYHAIKTKIGDGYKGWPEHAPFDAIILTAAADRIPQPLQQQLKPGGVLVMPEGEPRSPQMLIKVTKSRGGELSKERLLPVRFVPMTGEIQNGN